MSIEDYEFIDILVDRVWHSSNNGVNIKLRSKANSVIIYRKDVIALAKHFKLTASDINCTEAKALRDELDEADSDHFDECAELRAEIARINREIEYKRMS